MTSVKSVTSSSALDESQCLLRSGDADESCCGGEVSDGDVTVVELSKLKLELGRQRRRKRASGKRSRDDGERRHAPVILLFTELFGGEKAARKTLF